MNTLNPYAASIDTAEPRSWRNFWRLMVAVAVLFVLPSLVVYGYLRYERAFPTLFQQYEDAAINGNVDRWQQKADRDTETILRATR